MTILAWHNNPALKAEAVADMTRHRDADEFIQGAFLALNGSPSGYRGCFHGCLTTDKVLVERGVTLAELARHEPDWHLEGERIWGIDRRVGYVLDRTFESLPADEAGAFAVAATEAIPVGADLGVVLSRWVLDILIDPDRGVWRHTREGSAQRTAVESVAALYRRRLAGDEPSAVEWTKARAAADASAAYAVVAYAADAADAAAASAADAAAASAADAYAAAAYAAAASAAAASAADAAAAAARTDAYRWQVERLLHHLRTAPVPAMTP